MLCHVMIFCVFGKWSRNFLDTPGVGDSDVTPMKATNEWQECPNLLVMDATALRLCRQPFEGRGGALVCRMARWFLGLCVFGLQPHALASAIALTSAASFCTCSNVSYTVSNTVSTSWAHSCVHSAIVFLEDKIISDVLEPIITLSLYNITCPLLNLSLVFLISCGSSAWSGTDMC